MNARVAAMISLGVLGGIDTYLTATILPVPVWVTFIAWASFVACGGGKSGFVKSVASNFSGIAVASCSLLAIAFSPPEPVFAAISVGFGTAAMIALTAVPLLSFAPAIVFGFASTVGTMVATNTTITTAGPTHPALVAAAAMLLGACFGFAAEIGANMLARKEPATA